MAAYGAGDQVAGQGKTTNLPNFVGELFKLSPLDTPFLSLIGGLTGGEQIAQTQWAWQDSIHRAAALQSVAEGADATFSSQKRNQRKNVVAIHQYGVELSYTKQAATGQLGGSGDSPTISSISILGNQPVMNERAFQLQIKLEQAALDVELMFLTGTYANPNTGAARQTQGIVGAVSTDTTTDYTATSGQLATRAVINDLAQKSYDNGAKMANCVLMVNSLPKLELGADYATSSTGWNVTPRSYNVFGVNITDIETEFGRFPIVLNRHLDEDTVMMIDLAWCKPKFLPIDGKGHFFLEPLAKSGAYDRDQLYGEIGLEYGPSGWHAKAENLHAV